MTAQNLDPGGFFAEAEAALAEEIHAEKYDDPHAGLHQDRLDSGAVAGPAPTPEERETAARRLFLTVAAKGRRSLAWRALPDEYRKLGADEAARQLAALDDGGDGESHGSSLAVAA